MTGRPANGGYPDNHNHFLLAGDSAIDAMVAAAEHAGISDFSVFSEHNFHLHEAREAIPYLAARWTPEGPPLPIGAYVEKVRAAGAGAPSVNVLLGLEVDVRPEDPAFERAATRSRRPGTTGTSCSARCTRSATTSPCRTSRSPCRRTTPGPTTCSAW